VPAHATDPPAAEHGPVPSSWLAGVVDRLPVPVVAFERDGTVHWVNRAMTDRLRASRDDMIGTSVAEWTHPDDREVARVATEMAASTPHLLTPERYRLRATDGTSVLVEAHGSVELGVPGIDVAIVCAVPVDARALVERVTTLVAEGADSEELLDAVVAAVDAVMPGINAAVVMDDDAGGRVVAGAHLDPSLVAFVDGDGSLGGRADALLGAGEPVLVDDLSQLSPSCRAAAAAAGFVAVAVTPVPDPGGRLAHLVGWSPDKLAALRFHLRSQRTFRPLLSLALQRRAHLHALERAARTDTLTGAANRLALYDQFRALDASAGSRSVLFIDLDGFKSVNDSYGHAVGDALLREVSERIHATVRVHDTVARLGGDEFAVVCPGLDDAAAATRLAERILEAVRAPFPLGSLTARVDASIGVAHADATTTGASLLDAADAAMYSAKRTGKGRVVLADGPAGGAAT
jgi:diguanylate cyclase (GGDEF)-like protein